MTKPAYVLPGGLPGGIARVLGKRGYDPQVAAIFAIDAMERGRLRGLTTDEAVEVVADFMTPIGVLGHCDLTPPTEGDKLVGARQINGQVRDTYQRSRKSWLIA